MHSILLIIDWMKFCFYTLKTLIIIVTFPCLTCNIFTAFNSLLVNISPSLESRLIILLWIATPTEFTGISNMRIFQSLDDSSIESLGNNAKNNTVASIHTLLWQSLSPNGPTRHTLWHRTYCTRINWSLEVHNNELWVMYIINVPRHFT